MTMTIKIGKNHLRIKSMRRLLPIILMGLLLSAPIPPAAAAAGETVSFIPQWVPQAQFAGFYVAYEKGFYRQRGLRIGFTGRR